MHYYSRVLLVFVYSIISFGLFSQATDSLLVQLEQRLQRGNVRALRDVATLLDAPPYVVSAQQLLQNYTLLTPSEWNHSNSTNQQERFLNLYYEQSERWQFSPLLDAFYLTPLEQQTVKHVVKSANSLGETERQLHLLVRDFRVALREDTPAAVGTTLARISSLGSAEANRFLLSLFAETGFQHPSEAYYALLINEIIKLPFAENLQLVLAHLEAKKLSRTKTIALLSQLTNVQVIENTNSSLTERYLYLLDSLGGMEQLRQYGYDQLFNLRPNFFNHPVDYYGMILSRAEPFPWIIKNAIQDVLNTEHPRSLFYVAAQLFHYRNRSNWVFSTDKLVEILRQQTGLVVAVENGRGELKFAVNLTDDIVALRNYVTYWAAHYPDYEWDLLRKRFVNKNQALAQTEVYESLFRRLNSSNDSVALESYLALTQGDEIEVLGLAKKYKDLLRNYNKSLPSFKYQYLEQLVQLVQFCQQNDYPYLTAPTIARSIEQLKSKLTPSDRHRIENELLSNLELSQITGLEYAGIVGVQVRPFTFSVGRILDRFYAENWSVITQDAGQLRLYLKKAELFKNMGTIGICNAYFKKFTNADDDLRQRLTEMYQVETDLDVLRSIKKLLANDSPAERLGDFFLNPTSVNKDEIDDLPVLQPTQYQMVMSALFDSETEAAEKQILRYVGEHLQIELVPYLMQILVQEIQTKTIAKLLNRIYHLKRTPEEWLLLWQTDGGNFRNWNTIFFNEQLTFLANSPTLTIKDINQLTQSDLYDSTYKELVLQSLTKLKSAAQIRRLKIEPKLNLSTDLPYVENFDFSYKELDDIGRLFHIDDTALLLDFMERKSVGFSASEKGSFYNSLFRNDWFVEYVNGDQLTAEQSDYIQTILKTYLYESELISEFEEQATIRNIAALNNQGKALAERLMASTRLDAGAAAVAEIQEAIIARITYAEIPIVLEYYDQLSEAYQYNFLNEDFGLPIFDLADVPTQRAVIQNHQRFTPREFYSHYLTKFGVDFKTTTGELDYQKIYAILKFEIITPFVAGGGNTRDYYTYGVIKLLELTFDTRLGYHPKLNENQRFYSYSAAKRATDWMQYLIEQHLVQPAVDEVPSFTRN